VCRWNVMVVSEEAQTVAAPTGRREEHDRRNE
jgi:hypothetical protein